MGQRWVSINRLALAFAMAMSASAHAGQTSCGPYRVGLKEYPQVYERPAKTADAGTEPGGLDREFFSLLAARSGCTFNYELESQPRVWARIREGTLDITSWVVPTEERQQTVVLIPILTVRPLAYIWTSANASTREVFLANQELRAISVKGTSYGDGYDSCLEQLTAKRVSYVADMDVAVRVFLARRVDLIITYPWVMARHMPALAGKVQVADWYADGPNTRSGLAMSKRTVRLEDQARLLDALRSMAADGTFKRLVDQYLPGGGIGFIEPLRALTGAEGSGEAGTPRR